jgi:hypothetical protein
VLDKSTTNRLTVERTFFHLGRGLRTLYRDFGLRTQRGHGSALKPAGLSESRTEVRLRKVLDLEPGSYFGSLDAGL